jgi:hypothetical protein
MRDHYSFWNFWLTISALVPTAALLCLVFVSDDFARRTLHITPDGLKLLNATVALFAFICVLIQLVWKPDSREAAHAYAVEYYGGMLDANELLDDATCQPSYTLLHGKDFRTRSLPPIRYAALARLKQAHLQTLCVSRLLERDPWMALTRSGFPPRGYRPTIRVQPASSGRRQLWLGARQPFSRRKRPRPMVRSHETTVS